MTRELLFSVTASDCDWNYYRGTGAGGQKRNKTSSAVRCKHRASGAVGQCDDTRSQHKNKPIAFRRMAETKEFKLWHKLEVSRLNGSLLTAKENADKAMRPKNLRIEGKEDGKWIVIDEEG